jgi:hypothetical protein
MRKTLSSIIILTCCLLLFNTAVLATPAVLEPSAFETKSAPAEGWYWLRNNGDYARWIFNPLEMSGGIVPRSVYLIVQAKVTNGENGGSGYETTLKMKVTGNGITETVKVRLHNTFRPKDPEMSGGLGYDAHGWGGPIRDRIWQGAEKITVTMEYPQEWKEAQPENIQVAFEKPGETLSVALGYMR